MFKELKSIYEFGKPSKLICKKYKDEYAYLLFNTSYLDDQVKGDYKIKIVQRLYHLIYNINEIPKCACGNLVEFNSNRKYRTYCCNKCKVLDADYSKRIERSKQTKYLKYGDEKYNNKEKTKTTCLEKYGVESSFQANSVKEKSKKTKLNLYGHDNFSNWEKGKETCIIKYGVDHNFKIPEVIQKRKNTWINNLDVDHPGKSKCSHEKAKNTNLGKYGVENVFQSDEIKKRIIITNNIKYGYDYHTQSPDYKQPFSIHTYTFPSGKVVTTQGYENHVLDILIKKYKEEDILVSKREIHKHLGHFTYEYENKQHFYYPDIYIKSENLLIEVKSSWTAKQNIDVNKLKAKSCIDRNFNFETWIFDKNGLIKK